MLGNSFWFRWHCHVFSLTHFEMRKFFCLIVTVQLKTNKNLNLLSSLPNIELVFLKVATETKLRASAEKKLSAVILIFLLMLTQLHVSCVKSCSPFTCDRVLKPQMWELKRVTRSRSPGAVGVTRVSDNVTRGTRGSSPTCKTDFINVI